MQHVNQQRAKIAGLEAEIAALRAGLADVQGYLTSSKFHQDTTVQTSDVLHRLSELSSAAMIAGEEASSDTAVELQAREAAAKSRREAAKTVAIWKRNGDPRDAQGLAEATEILAGDLFLQFYGRERGITLDQVAA